MLLKIRYAEVHPILNERSDVKDSENFEVPPI